MDTGEIIKKAGLKATTQRKIIYKLMMESGHSTIDDIISKLRQQHPEITISTIYRILDTFCQAGLLSKMNHPNGKSYFDITPSIHHHIFTNDNQVIDYIDNELSDFIINHLNLKGNLLKDYKIKNISIQIFVNNKNQIGLWKRKN
ncbi:MAG: transcriptional repressor [Paludibacter sp.]|nr:transcriptional repressor [Paludibacter sp.]